MVKVSAEVKSAEDLEKLINLAKDLKKVFSDLQLNIKFKGVEEVKGHG